MNFYKKNFKSILLLIIVTIIISILYCQITFRKIIDSMASILAIPSLILSVIVLKVVDIKPSNLNAYHKSRKIEESTKKKNKVKVKKIFGDQLKEISALNKNYINFYKTTVNNKEVSKRVLNACICRLEEFEGFFEDTKEYIFKDYLPEIFDLGGLKEFIEINDLISELDDEKKIEDSLSKIDPNIFKENISKEDMDNLKELFFENGLMVKYLKTCEHAYEEIQEGTKNEI